MSQVTNSAVVRPVGSDVNDDEASQLKVKKSKLFRATIAVCAVYAGVALLVLLASVFSESARSVLVEAAAPFTITLVTGMLLVILLLGVAVYKYEPLPAERVRTDPYACPDFYELERTPQAELETFPEKYRHLMSFRCRPKQGVFPAAVTSPTTAPAVFGGALKSVVADVNATLPSGSAMGCDRIYPMYMDVMDAKFNKDDPTRYLCAYINSTDGCGGLSWSATCPSPP